MPAKLDPTNKSNLQANTDFFKIELSPEEIALALKYMSTNWDPNSWMAHINEKELKEKIISNSSAHKFFYAPKQQNDGNIYFTQESTQAANPHEYSNVPQDSSIQKYFNVPQEDPNFHKYSNVPQDSKVNKPSNINKQPTVVTFSLPAAKVKELAALQKKQLSLKKFKDTLLFKGDCFEPALDLYKKYATTIKSNNNNNNNNNNDNRRVRSQAFTFGKNELLKEGGLTDEQLEDVLKNEKLLDQLSAEFQSTLVFQLKLEDQLKNKLIERINNKYNQITPLFHEKGVNEWEKLRQAEINEISKISGFYVTREKTYESPTKETAPFSCRYFLNKENKHDTVNIPRDKFEEAVKKKIADKEKYLNIEKIIDLAEKDPKFFEALKELFEKNFSTTTEKKLQ